MLRHHPATRAYRNCAILRAYLTGQALQSISTAMNVTRARVNHLVYKGLQTIQDHPHNKDESLTRQDLYERRQVPLAWTRYWLEGLNKLEAYYGFSTANESFPLDHTFREPPREKVINHLMLDRIKWTRRVMQGEAIRQIADSVNRSYPSVYGSVHLVLQKVSKMHNTPPLAWTELRHKAEQFEPLLAEFEQEVLTANT